ncbi:MAG TPA: ATP-binding protein [Stellaceae bacterium]
MNFLSLDRPRFPQNSLRAYLIAAAAVAMAGALRLILASWFLRIDATGLPYATFFAAVIAVAFLCGSIAGLFAGFLSLLLAWRFTIVPGDPRLSSLQTCLFGVGTLTVTALIAVMRAASAHVRRLNATLRASEAKLQRNQVHFERAQCIAAIGSTEIDFRTGEWIWSDEIFRIYGLDKNTLSPTSAVLGAMVHPDDRARYLSDSERAFRGEAVDPLEFRIIRPNGEVRIIYREVEIIRDEAGCVAGAIATKQDVTDLRRAEAEREQLRQDLFHAQRLDALGRLAGGIAHDINNSLVPVVALTSVVSKNLPPNSPDVEALTLVREAADHIKLLVQQILAFGRPQQGHTMLVDPTAFLRDALHFVRATVPTTINIATKIEPAPLLRADAGQLHQVLINLITNAIDAIGGRQGTITVSLSEARPVLLQGQLCARLSIGDTGCGMDEQTLGKIFEPFFTTKEVDKGTGLGLSVVYGIVGAHGGRIDVTSAVGQGARFDVFLPAMPCTQDDFSKGESLVAA